MIPIFHDMMDWEQRRSGNFKQVGGCSAEQLKEFQCSSRISELPDLTLRWEMNPERTVKEPRFQPGWPTPSPVALDASLVLRSSESLGNLGKPFHSLSAQSFCDFPGLCLRTGRDFICSQLDTTQGNQKVNDSENH